MSSDNQEKAPQLPSRNKKACLHRTCKEAKEEGVLLLESTSRRFASAESKNLSKDKLNKQLYKLAKELDVQNIYLPNNYNYDLEDVAKSIPNIKKAIMMLTKKERLLLSPFSIVLAEQGGWFNTYGAKKTTTGDVVMHIDYNADALDIQENIRDGLKIADTDIMGLLMQNKGGRVDALLGDLMLQDIIEDVDKKNILFDITRELPDRKAVEMMVMIARNLFIQLKAINPKNAREEYEAIIEKRKRYRDIPVFAGRNVLCVANNEQIKDMKGVDAEKYAELKNITGGDRRFLVKATSEEIKRQSKTFNFVDKVGRSSDEVYDVIRGIEQKIINTPPPLTFVFDGHGNKKAMILVNGQRWQLREDYIAEWIVARRKKWSDPKYVTPEMQDIFIFDCCLSNNFLRNIHRTARAQLKKEGIHNFISPIFFSASEYG